MTKMFKLTFSSPFTVKIAEIAILKVLEQKHCLCLLKNLRKGTRYYPRAAGLGLAGSLDFVNHLNLKLLCCGQQGKELSDPTVAHKRPQAVVVSNSWCRLPGPHDTVIYSSVSSYFYRGCLDNLELYILPNKIV